MDDCASGRLALVIGSLDAGGAERVMSIMANHWAVRGWQVTLVTIDSADTDFYKLHPGVKRVALGVAGYSRGLADAVAHNVRRIGRLRAALRAAQPQAVISFVQTTNVLAVIAGRLEGIPVIVSERGDPLRTSAGTIWNGLRRVAYPRADAVVVQTPEVRQWAEGFLSGAVVHTIPNPVFWPPEESTGAATLARAVGTRQVVAVGRLDRLKGFDVLIRAFAICHSAFPTWMLTILGEGPERTRLEALALELNVAGAVRMPGRVRDPYAALREADLFVLSSLSEGFPNVLLEAMAMGLAVVSTDCESGPRHIIRDGFDGVLVPPENVESMATAMAALMGDDVQRDVLASRAQAVRDRFSVVNVMREWDQLVEQVAPSAPQRKLA